MAPSQVETIALGKMASIADELRQPGLPVT